MSMRDLKNKKEKRKEKESKPTKTVVIRPLSYIQILSPSIRGHHPLTPQATTYMNDNHHLEDHNNFIMMLS